MYHIYNSEMLIKIEPENLEVANLYLQEGSIQKVAHTTGVSEDTIAGILCKREVKSYIDSVYLDLGYRNRFKLAETLDKIIEAKMEECEESGIYSSKDLADLLLMAHKMRMDEIKAMTDRDVPIKNQTNVQINETPFGSGNYGKLMEKLLKND